MFGQKKAAPEPAAAPLMPSERDFQRADFHIERFSRALEQCTKGDERCAELQTNLEYWQTIKSLKEMRRP